MKKPILILAAVLLLLAGLGGAWFATSRQASAPTYQTATVDRGPLAAKVTATGKLSPLVTVQVGSQVSGRIQDLLVDYNSTVKKGQVLVRLDPQLFMAALERERANHVAAQSNVRKAEVEALNAKQQLARTRYLAERQLIAQAELDTAQARHDTAQAQVILSRASLKQAQASLHQAEVNLSYTTISSPVDGVVISRSVDVGQTVAASLQAPTLFLIAQDLRKVQVNTSVSEADIGKLRPGIPAEFTVDAYPGETFVGQVRQIRNDPKTEQNVVTYDAVLDVANPDQKLKPGMTANVSFLYDQRANALRVPNATLRFRMPEKRAEGTSGPGRERMARGERSEGTGEADRMAGSDRREGRRDASMRRIWVLRDGQPAPVSVKLGLNDGAMTEVVSGELQEGDRVLTGIVGATGPSQNRPRGQGQGNRQRSGGLF